VNDDAEPVEIVSRKGKCQLDLRRSVPVADRDRIPPALPANAQRLVRGVADAEAGRTEEHELLP